MGTGHPSDGDDGAPPAVLVTIHGRVWPGVLRGRLWSEERGEWRCTVEIWVDDRAVLTTVAAGQVEFVAPPGGE